MKIKRFNESQQSSWEILINYDSGNSLESEHGLEESVTPEWNSEKSALENLDRIEEHYKFYKKLNDYYRSYRNLFKDRFELFRESSQKDWAIIENKIWSKSRDQVVDKGYQQKNPDDCEVIPFVLESALKLYDDGGSPITQSAFWCGYFEKLNWAEVRPKGNKYKRSF